MKKVMKTVVAASLGVFMCGLLLAGNAAAQSVENTDPSFRVGMYRVNNTLKMNLMMEKKEGENVFVKVLDSKGKVLEEQRVGKKVDKVCIKLDFSQAGDGNYTVEVSNGSDRVVKNVKLFTNDIVETPARTLVAIY